MPSQENVKLKQAIIDEIGEKMEKASGVVVVDYIGITVDEANAMRVKLREAEVDYKVYKNTLVRRAVEGTPNEGLKEILEGPSAFAFGYEDAIAPARVLDGVMKELKKMEFKAGIIEGVLYDAAGIKQIASIPSREVLISKFLGSIQSPISKLVRTFAAIADDMGPANADSEERSDETGEAAPAEEAAAEAAPAEEEPVIASDSEAIQEPPADEAAPAEEAAAEAAPTDEEPVIASDSEASQEPPAEEAAQVEDDAPTEEAAAEAAPAEEAPKEE